MKEKFTETILEKKAGDRFATRFRRSYSIAEKAEKDDTKKAIYSGQTVFIERKKGGKVEISMKGMLLTETEAPDLFKSLQKSEDEPRNEDFLPDRAVKVGESWKIPPEKSEKMFRSLGEEKMKVDVKKSTVGGKLVKVYQKDGAQFGTLELTIDVIVTEIDVGGEFAKADEGSTIRFKATLDICIDGTDMSEDVKMSVAINITAKLRGDGVLTIAGSSTGTEKVRSVK